jgi:queuine/archaeosine tRNA-ribosyltransferase
LEHVLNFAIQVHAVWRDAVRLVVVHGGLHQLLELGQSSLRHSGTFEVVDYESERRLEVPFPNVGHNQILELRTAFFNLKDRKQKAQ